MNILALAQYTVVASQNLFSPEWTEGNLYAIEDVTRVLGTVACWVISVVGFGIVIFSIIKNALSGLYVVNPVLWDKVDAIKRDMESSANSLAQNGIGVQGPGNKVAQKFGSLGSLVLSYLPNVKELTDFAEYDENGNLVETKTLDKKQYFMKSIPALIAQIFIGMLIFYGYPAKVTNFIGSAGTEVIDMVLNNVDPATAVGNLFNKVQNVHFQTADSTHPFDKFVFESSSAMYTSIVSRLTDMEKEPRQDMAYQIETAVTNAFTPYSQILGAEQGFKISTTADYTTMAPSVSGTGWTQLDNGVYMSTSSNGVITYKCYWNMSNFSTGNSQKLGPSDYITVTAVATPEAIASASASSISAYEGTITQESITINTTKKETHIKLSNNIKYDKGGNLHGCFSGTLGTVGTFIYKDTNNKYQTATAVLEQTGSDLKVLVKKALSTTDKPVGFILGSNATIAMNISNANYTASCRLDGIYWSPNASGTSYVPDTVGIATAGFIAKADTASIVMESADEILDFVKNGNRHVEDSGAN